MTSKKELLYHKGSQRTTGIALYLLKLYWIIRIEDEESLRIQDFGETIDDFSRESIK